MLPFDPAARNLDAVVASLDKSLADYRADYAAYYERCKRPNSPAMRDPNAVIYLVPGVGMLSFAKDKATARIAAEFYVNAINVMRGASSVSRYVGLAEQEAFDIEYWLLEEAKLQRMPKPKSLAGRVALVTGGAGGIGQAIAARLMGEGACVVLADIDAQSLDAAVADFGKRFGKDAVAGVRVDVTSEPAVEAAFRDAVLAYGGIDIVVANAGIASAAPFEDTSLELWNRNFAILATGYFLSARAGYRIMKDQGLGGSIVFIASKNALAASPGASAYCTAKAAEVHLARCLALEGAPARHSRQYRQSGRGAARFEDLAGRMAGAARRLEQGQRDGARRGLPPALAAEAVRVPRGHRRGGLLFRLRSFRQKHRQHPQRRRGQRRELHPLRTDANGAAMSYRIPEALIGEENAALAAGAGGDYAALGRRLGARGVDIEAITAKVAAFAVAVPTWGVGTGGTRFARFPGPGEPRGIFDKLEDCATIHQLTRATPTCSPHFPWDKVGDYRELAECAAALGVGFDAVNSNTFQDQPGQTLSYKFGSLSHGQKAVRDQAVAHNVECIEIGEKLGSKALTVWIADGSNFPGQSNLNRVFDWYLESMSEIYARLPGDWRVFLEHKLNEPAFYSTVISDWGTSLMAAQALGPKAHCLVDLGHHAPNVNIEQIVSRLIRAGRLAGFHFNDSKYGDDDLDTGSIDPFRLFRVFNELVDASAARRAGLRSRLHARSVAQRDRSDREPDRLGDGDAARLCAGAHRRPGSARRSARRE